MCLLEWCWLYVDRHCRTLTPDARVFTISHEHALDAHHDAVVMRFLTAADKAGIGPITRVLFYTGMRLGEVRGLLVGDVDLEAGKIRLRPHAHRRLKTKKSRRDVPIWPALRPVLTSAVRGREAAEFLFTDVDGQS